MVLGIAHLGKQALKMLLHRDPTRCEAATGFVVLSVALSEAMFLLAFTGIAYLWVCRLIGGLVIIAGIYAGISVVGQPRASETLTRLQQFFQCQTSISKTAVIVAALSVIGLWLIALGPPTDADSLNYHLGVPLDVLRHHALSPRTDWLHYRLVGLGEYLNLIGLACGTDVLGACLQFSGLVILVLVITSLSKEGRTKVFAALCIVSSPVMIFLVASQKPQLFPAAANTAALILIVKRFGALDKSSIFLALVCIFFAVGCKHSFVLSSFAVWLALMAAAYRSRTLGIACFLSFTLFTVILLPLYLQKYLAYGDPLSPFLERFKSVPDPITLRFAAFLKTYKGPEYVFPLNLVWPSSLGSISTVIGMGVLSVFTISKISRRNTILIFCAVLATSLIWLLGQSSTRYYFEPYLWLVAAMTTTGWNWRRTWVLRLLILQGTMVLCMLIYGVVTVTPGAVSDALRRQVMRASAYHYDETHWLDLILPSEAVVYSGIRSLALMPRPFLSSERQHFSDNSDEVEQAQLEAMLHTKHVNYLVTYRRKNKPNVSYFAGPYNTSHASRNPWNRRQYSIWVYRITPESYRVLAGDESLFAR
jgi:hypothetical protein